MRIQDAYEITETEEPALPVDLQAEAQFFTGLAKFWCKENCEVMETRPMCKFFGMSNRCKQVARKKRADTVRVNDFYVEQRAAVRKSQERVRVKGVRWMESHKLDSEAGAAWRAEFEAELAEATAARRFKAYHSNQPFRKLEVAVNAGIITVRSWLQMCIW
jgi:hypothetical protein